MYEFIAECNLFRLDKIFFNIDLQKYDRDLLFVFLKPRDVSESHFRDSCTCNYTNRILIVVCYQTHLSWSTAIITLVTSHLKYDTLCYIYIEFFSRKYL